MARNLSSKKRREIKDRKILSHQIEIEGIEPVYELTLSQHLLDGAVYPVSVYKAMREPIVEGYPRDSQTAVVMRMLESYGSEFARL
jgi:hypothetical protein